MPRLAPFLAELSARLRGVSETPLLDLQVACAELLDVDRAWLLSRPELELTPAQAARLEELTRRLESGEPLPYILGHWEFYGLDFIVNPTVLIPRPETELLVEEGLNWLKRTSPPAPRLQGKGRLALDVGCGSGCIGIALAVNAPGINVVASDISRSALQTAQTNARKHQVCERVTCVQADLLPATRRPFDLVCANLPYIPEQTLRGLKLAEWEPVLALWGGPDGSGLIRRLLEQLRDRPASLAPGGLVLLEIESSLGQAALDLAREAFPNARVRLLQDLAGLDRCIEIQTNLHPA
jgi:release factor glutamine methyltransferase